MFNVAISGHRLHVDDCVCTEPVTDFADYAVILHYCRINNIPFCALENFVTENKTLPTLGEFKARFSAGDKHKVFQFAFTVTPENKEEWAVTCVLVHEWVLLYDSCFLSCKTKRFGFYQDLDFSTCTVFSNSQRLAAVMEPNPVYNQFQIHPGMPVNEIAIDVAQPFDMFHFYQYLRDYIQVAKRVHLFSSNIEDNIGNLSGLECAFRGALQL